MDLKFIQVTYQGPPLVDELLLGQLPADYRGFLTQVNGLIMYRGGLHIRGVCETPPWHALTPVWRGDYALHARYPLVAPTDIPFGQDAVGDQFLLRDNVVYRLAAETGDLDSLQCTFYEFLQRAQGDPLTYLQLQPLEQFYHEGKMLDPGQLINVYPPFCTKQAAQGVSLRAVPTFDRLDFLAEFARQIRGISDGGVIQIDVQP